MRATMDDSTGMKPDFEMTVEEISPRAMVESLSELVKYVKSLEDTLRYARAHIVGNIFKFAPKDLHCMALDGIIEYGDIPDELSDDFVKMMKKHEKPEEAWKG